ncbi:uncharacterized protein EKO05_0011352 [Ascochyta rabiei]|uniref:Uncharacterized protein n=1 Tax=Didymella rabiei TaxID=5454 RepID=A0A163C7E5_DIDRA|nr:uncharacterized protein EKO05_0011352 [Ascochyta rabiei]KZM22255.1 hypothetical protein ST47_g6595 [Ascochyta rabiei]UPX21154.1 hypothetical protein EKO05_0011352 [Ascochyta rabiei]
MRSFLLMAVMALLAFVSAMPITPSAPQLQKRAEQFRLEGLREFDIAERLSAPIVESDELEPLMSRVHSKLSALFESLANADEEEIDAEGDVAPGSMEAPQMLPKAAAHGSSLYQSLCALFHGGKDDYGYEGKELELRRPEGMKHWGGGR